MPKAASLFTVLALLLAACPAPDATAGKKGGGKREFPVEVEEVRGGKIEYSISAVGSVEPFEVVQITARVSGVIERVQFSEGQAITEKDVIVEIDPVRYSLEVRAAQATLDRRNASLNEANEGLARRTGPKANKELFSDEEVRAWDARVKIATAEVAEATVAYDRAKLNAEYARVRSPVAGIIETRTVTTGTFVQAGAVLATIVRRDPMMLRFSVPEQEAPRLKPGMVARFRSQSELTELAATIRHVSSAADVRTRMVEVVAEVAPSDSARARPGSFAVVTVPVSVSENAPGIPQTAVRPTDRGFLAYVLENGVAKERVLTLGLRTPDGRVEVRSGLKIGESVVIRGGEALRDGAAVKVEGAKQGEPAKPAN